MIENAVRPRVDKRRADFLASKSLVADLGFPMRRRSDAPTTYQSAGSAPEDYTSAPTRTRRTIQA